MFVFGGLTNEGEMPFFLNVLLPIVFISVLIGIFQYLKIWPLVITPLYARDIVDKSLYGAPVLAVAGIAPLYSSF